MRAKKRAGLRHCRDAAGYGFTFRHGRHVPHAAEQAIILRIVEMRQAGHSFERIARRLLLDCVTTKDGQECSEDRCRRACLAAMRRQKANP